MTTDRHTDDQTVGEEGVLALLRSDSAEDQAKGLRLLGIFPAEELVAEFTRLSEADADKVRERASFWRYGPTGMNEADALVAAMQEFKDGDLPV